MGFYEDFLRELEKAANETFKNPTQLARHLGVETNLITRWLKRERVPKADTMGKVLDVLGLRLSGTGGDLSRDVYFVNDRQTEAGANLEPPHADDYMAVPIVEEVGAGPGMIPQGEFKSWFLVYKHQEAVRYRNDLIAVTIGKHSTSMIPTLHPGDIVLVDRQDRSTQHPGRMMLVMDPDGEGKIKRVAVEQKNNDHRLTFYSDNAAENPPEIYSLREDFFNNWDRAIAGRVVWAWSDISSK